MRIVGRDDVYFYTLRVYPYKIIVDGKIFFYYPVSSGLNKKLGYPLSGLSFDTNGKIIFVISESLDVYIMEIIIKGYVYQLGLDENSKIDAINDHEKQNYFDTVKYEFDLAIKYCEKYMINPARYLIYKLGILICMIDEMESTYQDITDIQKAIDFLTENLEYFICDPQEDNLLIKT